MKDIEFLTKLLSYTTPQDNCESLAIKLLNKYGNATRVLLSDDELLDNNTKTLFAIVVSSAKKITWELELD